MASASFSLLLHLFPYDLYENSKKAMVFSIVVYLQLPSARYQ